MKSDFELVLEECLAQIRAGKALEECLSAHPAQAKRLRPLLEAAARVWAIPIPRARVEAVQAGRERLLAQANSHIIAASPGPSARFARYTKQALGFLTDLLLGKERHGLKLAYRLAATLMVVFFVAGIFTVNASAGSLPGDTLYSVKRTWESLRLSLTPDEKSHQHLIEQYAEKRRKEVKELIHRRRAETVEFTAPLEAMVGDQWQVNGFQVQIGSDTEVKGMPEIGLALYIRARLEEDGTLTALQVRIPDRDLPTPHPTGLPTTGITPQMTEDAKVETTETYEPTDKPDGTAESTEEGQAEEEHEEKGSRTPEPEDGAAQTPQTHPTRTPEPTEQHENDDEHENDRTPELTEQIHETPKPTDDD